MNNGTLGLPPLVGEFNGGPSTTSLGEFYDQETWNGRAILVRYQWFNLSPTSSRMEQSFSADGGKTWEINWTCELTRASPLAARRTP